MFAKITIAIALILGTASGALAAPKQKQHTSRTYLHHTHGQHGRSASRVKTAHVKTTHFKAVQKQKHRTTQAYATYESWSFGSATSAFAMANPQRTSYRYEELYNTRAQVSGPASRAVATSKQKHSRNPGYDVYNTRGWYIGSDPDATIRFMMAMDPSYSD